jgi:SAM-dependent methyltransferase
MASLTAAPAAGGSLLQLLDRERRVLADTVRTGAYRAAIVRLVRPGDVVVNLGAGTGILAILCARAGARRVYALEPSPLARLGRELAAANGVGDRVEFVEGEVGTVRLAERADVLVTSGLDAVPFRDNPLPLLLEARDRLLSPGARVIPERVEVHAAPVEAPAVWEQLVGLWLRPAYELDLSRIGHVSRHQLHEAELEPRGLLAPAARVHVLELGGAPSAGFEAQRYLAVARDGTLHGLSLWLEIRFAADLALSTSPAAPPTAWQHAFLPAPRPIAVSAGTRLGLVVEAIPDGPVLHWRATVRLGDHPTMPAYGLDTRLGFLRSAP